jgi:hypothetical protein
LTNLSGKINHQLESAIGLRGTAIVSGPGCFLLGLPVKAGRGSFQSYLDLSLGIPVGGERSNKKSSEQNWVKLIAPVPSLFILFPRHISVGGLSSKREYSIPERKG